MKINSPSTITHTPGPYFYQRDSEGCDDLWLILAQAGEKYIATIAFWDEHDNPAYAAGLEANARLLAASPDMFDALKEIVEAFNGLEITVAEGTVFRAPQCTTRNRVGRRYALVSSVLGRWSAPPKCRACSPIVAADHRHAWCSELGTNAPSRCS